MKTIEDMDGAQVKYDDLKASLQMEIAKCAPEFSSAHDLSPLVQHLNSTDDFVQVIHARGLRDFYWLRRKWSWFLLCAIGILLIFQCILVYAIGAQWVDFTNYQDFLKIQSGVYFAHIVGMGYIVVRFLFGVSRPAKDAGSAIPLVQSD